MGLLGGIIGKKDDSAEDSKLAVLVDADNATPTPSLIGPLLQEINRYGVVYLKRAYGDWTTPTLGPWKDQLLIYGIQPIQQFAYTTGKNATDSAMIIDAMDLLYTGKYDGFCLVSSDSDFTRLATRIREDQLTVYGFGRKQTPQAFVNACTKFVYVEILQGKKAAAKKAVAAKPKAQAVAKKVEKPAPFKGYDEAREIFIQAIEEKSTGKDQWVQLALLGNYVMQKHPNFTPKKYGYGRIRTLLNAMGKDIEITVVKSVPYIRRRAK